MKRFFTFLRHYKQFGVAILTMIIGLALEFGGLHTAAHWLLGVVALVSVIPLVMGMWEDLRTGSYGLDILALTAIITSVVLHEYWAAIVIVVMLTGGEALEDYAEHRAKGELDALLSRVPQKATIMRGRKTLTVKVGEIQVGDKVIIKPGEVVPVDATIVEGSASFDESSLTGESLPQAKSASDELLSGSVNLDGAIVAKCTNTAEDSQYEQIIKLVRAAQNSQAPFVRLADRYSIPFTIISYVIAFGAWFIGGEPIRFLEVIVVATPCPLLLAAPIAIISGMSRAAKHGVIIKTGSALERLAQAKTIAFDKTGTLTHGTFSVAETVAFSPFKKDELLGLAASLEQNSNHVLAHAIVEKATAAKAKIPKARHVKETAGKGVAATVNSRDVLVGRLNFLQEQDVTLPKSFKATAQKQTATYVAIDGALAGYITFTDTVREDSRATIRELGKLNVATLMVTGDNAASAKVVAKQLGVKEVHADMLPGDKLRAIEAVKDRPVAFVGDGVNDAPVLTASDVGIALGAKGSTAASESADMVIMLDDISRVARVVQIAKHTFQIARQSILIGIAMSVGLMLIFATGHFPPLAGAILQEVVDVFVIFNALRAHGSFARAH